MRIYICFGCLDLYSKCLDLSLGVWTCLRVFGPGPGPGPGRGRAQDKDQAGPTAGPRAGPRAQGRDRALRCLQQTS